MMRSTQASQSFVSRRAALAAAALVALTLGGVATATAQEATAQEAAGAPQALPTAPACHDQVWLISAREITCCRCGEAPRLHFWRSAGCRWAPSSLEEFLASDVPGMPTCFWIHGWRVSHCDAQQIGWIVYRRLKSQACGPFRLVIWSWPSEQTAGLLQDARQKAHLADVGAYPLAWVVDQIDPRVPVSMVGFSLGARIATGSLHLLGGGCLVGCRLERRAETQRCPIRAVLLAGALDNFSLAAGQRNGLALCETERVLVMVNDSDAVLQWYPLLCGIGGPRAIGYTGAAGYLGPCHDAYEQMHVGHIVGRQHDWAPYFQSCFLLGTIADVALFPNHQGAPSPLRSAPHAQRLPLRPATARK